jgi:hypothetical protein
MANLGPSLPDLEGDLLLRLVRRALRVLKAYEDWSELPGVARTLNLVLLSNWSLSVWGGGMGQLHSDYLSHQLRRNRIDIGELVAAYEALGMPERAALLRELGELIARTPPEKIRALLRASFIGEDGLRHWATDDRPWRELSPSVLGHLALWIEGQRENPDLRALLARARKRKGWHEHVWRKKSLARWAVDHRCSPLLIRAFTRGMRPSRLRRLLVRAVERSSPQVVQILLRAGADPNAVMLSDHPLVLKAALRAPVCHVLIDAGADVHARSSRGNTILHYLRDAPLAERVLALGADPQVQSETGESILSHAAHCGDLDLVKLYVRAGVDPLSLDYAGRTPLAIAVERREWPLADCLAAGLRVVTDMDGGAGLTAFTALHAAAAHDRHDVVAELLAQGASRRVRTRDDVMVWVDSPEDWVGTQVTVPAGSTARDVAVQLGAQRAVALL